MQYGENKRRTMMRSILPSTARKGAREDKNAINRRRRARVRSDLHDVWDLESAEEWDADWIHKDLDYKTTYVVWDRRGADKVSHFIRWAEAKTAHIEDDHEKIPYMRQFLPNNMIGRHAESHLPYDWDPNAHARWWYRYGVIPRTPEERYLVAYELFREIFNSDVLYGRFLPHWRTRTTRSHEIVDWVETYYDPIADKQQTKEHFRHVQCERCAYEPAFGSDPDDFFIAIEKRLVDGRDTHQYDREAHAWLRLARSEPGPPRWHGDRGSGDNLYCIFSADYGLRGTNP